MTPVGTDDQVDFYPWDIEAFPEEIETTWEVGDVPYPAEQIAATQPDLIVDLMATDAASFDQVAEIAPVVGAPSEGETLWQERILVLGEVLDLSERAQQVIDDYEADLQTLRDTYPSSRARPSTTSSTGARSTARASRTPLDRTRRPSSPTSAST